MNLVYLAELQAYNLTTSTIETLRFCSNKGYTDSSGNFYHPRMEQPGLVTRSVLSATTFGGAAQNQFGEMTLVNIDGGLDYLAGYSFDGRDFALKLGDETADISTFTIVTRAIIDRFSLEYSRANISLRDKTRSLDIPAQPLLFAGDNVLPAGLEGVEDLKGRRKPLILGTVKNISPVMVNSSKLVYQLSTAAISATGLNVRDKGVALTYAGTYANETDMMADTTLSAGSYKALLSSGMIRLGSTPAGTITADCQSSATPNSTATEIIRELVYTYAGIASDGTTNSDFSALTSANNDPLGIVIEGEMTIAEAIDHVARSVGAWFGFDQLNRFRVKQVVLPSGLVTLEIDEFQVIAIERESLSSGAESAPVWQYALNYAKNFTVQGHDSLAGSVSAADKAFYAEEWRKQSTSDSAVKTAHLSAQDLLHDSYFINATDALAEASRRLTILKSQLVLFKVTVRIDFNLAVLSGVTIGINVMVKYPRFGLDGSANNIFKIVSMTADYRIGQIELGLWGPA